MGSNKSRTFYTQAILPGAAAPIINKVGSWPMSWIFPNLILKGCKFYFCDIHPVRHNLNPGIGISKILGQYFINLAENSPAKCNSGILKHWSWDQDQQMTSGFQSQGLATHTRDMRHAHLPQGKQTCASWTCWRTSIKWSSQKYGTHRFTWAKTRQVPCQAAKFKIEWVDRKRYE